MTLTTSGDICLTEIAPTDKSLSELQTLSIAWTGQQVNASGKLVPVTPAEFARRLAASQRSSQQAGAVRIPFWTAAALLLSAPPKNLAVAGKSFPTSGGLPSRLLIFAYGDNFLGAKMNRTRKIDVGDQVTDRLLQLTWTVVDFGDDGTIYIERNGVRAFTRPGTWRRASMLPEAARGLQREYRVHAGRKLDVSELALTAG